MFVAVLQTSGQGAPEETGAALLGYRGQGDKLSRILNIADKADQIESYADRGPLVEVELWRPQRPNCL